MRFTWKSNKSKLSSSEEAAKSTSLHIEHMNSQDKTNADFPGNVEGATTSRYAVASGLTVSAGDEMKLSPKAPSFIGTALATGAYA